MKRITTYLTQLSFGCELKRLQYFFINEETRMENQGLLLPERKMLTLATEDQLIIWISKNSYCII